MTATIVRVASALDQLSVFQVVEHPDELTAIDSEDGGDGSLCRRVPLCEEGQNAVLVHAEARLLELLERPGLHRQAGSCEQKQGAREQLSRQHGRAAWRLRDLGAHGNKPSAAHRSDLSWWT